MDTIYNSKSNIFIIYYTYTIMILDIKIGVQSYQLNDDATSFCKVIFIEIFRPTRVSVEAILLADELPVGTASNFPMYHPIHYVYLYV